MNKSVKLYETKPTAKTARPAAKLTKHLTLWQRHKLKIIFGIIGLIILIGVAVWLIHEFAPEIYKKQDEIRQFIKGFGIFSPVIFVIFQAVQIIVAPIPGNFTTIAGGWLFGWFGILWTMVGATLGFWVVILLSRRFGRPLIEKIFKKDQIKKFDFVAEKDGALVLFLIFLLPIFPDDLLSYLAGLTKIRTRNLLLISIVGRLPNYLLLNLLGAGMSEGAVRQIVVTLSALLLVAGICFFARNWLMALMKSDRKGQFVRDSWHNLWARFSCKQK